MKNFFNRQLLSPAAAAASAVLLVSLSVGAATTISTSIVTGGGVFASSTSAFTGVVSYASSTLQGTQMATAKVGPTGTSLSGLTMGYCNIVSANINATTTATFACTGATGVVSGDRLFVSATSSLPSTIYVQSANSTTTAGTVEVNLYFDGTDAATKAPGSISFNYWAVR